MWDKNPYYNPVNLGLELIAERELSEPSWSFDTFIVLREIETGKVYVGSDSGCSCPTPFEDHSFPQDFIEVFSWEDVKREFNNALSYSDGSYEPINDVRHKVVGAFGRGR